MASHELTMAPGHESKLPAPSASFSGLPLSSLSHLETLDQAQIDSSAYENYPGREPAGYAEQCLGPVSWISTPQPGFAPSDTGNALDIGLLTDNFVFFTLDDFPGQTVLDQNVQLIVDMDFDSTATTLYGLDNDLQALGTIDPPTGAWTTIGPGIPADGHTLTGLAVDHTDDTLYACTRDGVGSMLYTFDPASGALTQVGPMGITLSIAIAVNGSGQMYAHDIGTDSIYTVDTATGATTLVGPSGFDANFVGTVDLGTGTVTPLAQDNPQGEFGGAVANRIPVELLGPSID